MAAFCVRFFAARLWMPSLRSSGAAQPSFSNHGHQPARFDHSQCFTHGCLRKIRGPSWPVTLCAPLRSLLVVIVARHPYGEVAALGRVEPVAFFSALLKSSKIFSGSGKTIVVFFSTPISVKVWR